MSETEPSTCGRCRATIPPDEYEVCWACQSELCFACWEAVGHCGHADAEELMARANRGVSP